MCLTHVSEFVLIFFQLWHLQLNQGPTYVLNYLVTSFSYAIAREDVKVHGV